MRKETILISGIGIAGSTLAYWLGAHGFSPTLVERAPRLRTGGYVIDFWGRGYDIAGRMGLIPALRSAGYDIRELRLVDGQGRWVGGFQVEVFRTLTAGRYVSLPRGDLVDMIYHKIDGRFECIFGDSIAGLEADADGVQVTFERSRPRRFDLVVGADGLNSVVRKLAFGPRNRFEKFLGCTVAAFEVAGYPHRDELVYVAHCLPGKQVARFALRDGRTLFLLIFRSPPPAPADRHDLLNHKAELHAEFDSAGWECPQILAAMDACEEIYFDPVSQIRMDAWTRGRITLVGDAASCPSLLAGQGSALAMVGAYVLAGELGRRAGQLLPGLQRYEEIIRPFLEVKQRAAEKFRRSFLPKTRLGLLVRNQLTKTLALPFAANVLMRRSLLDRFELPDYSPPTAA